MVCQDGPQFKFLCSHDGRVRRSGATIPKEKSESASSGFLRHFAERLSHAENEVPQPQVPVALGLVNLKPPP
jgi:hypothetical protein